MGILKTNEQTYYGASGAYGDYRYLSLQDVINSFMATYVGEGKICDKVMNSDVAFHAIRAMQELSYDTLKCTKDWEIEVPASLVMVMPVDYINYVKVSFTDSAGIQHIVYPSIETSNPKDIEETIQAYGGFTTDGSNEDLDGTTDSDGNNSSTTWTNYQKGSPVEIENDDEEDHVYWPSEGKRFGLDPARAQVNGSFYIDEDQGKFHFSSNLSGKTIVLKYISDGLVTKSDKSGLDLENTLVPKLAEEAIYKWILYGVLLARKDTQGGLLAEIKKQRFAETRKAKLRLSNIKIEEITRILRGKSKWIKH